MVVVCVCVCVCGGGGVLTVGADLDALVAIEAGREVDPLVGANSIVFLQVPGAELVLLRHNFLVAVEAGEGGRERRGRGERKRWEGGCQ